MKAWLIWPSKLTRRIRRFAVVFLGGGLPERSSTPYPPTKRFHRAILLVICTLVLLFFIFIRETKHYSDTGSLTQLGTLPNGSVPCDCVPNVDGVGCMVFADGHHCSVSSISNPNLCSLIPSNLFPRCYPHANPPHYSIVPSTFKLEFRPANTDITISRLAFDPKVLLVVSDTTSYSKMSSAFRHHPRSFRITNTAILPPINASDPDLRIYARVSNYIGCQGQGGGPCTKTTNEFVSMIVTGTINLPLHKKSVSPFNSANSIAQVLVHNPLPLWLPHDIGARVIDEGLAMFCNRAVDSMHVEGGEDPRVILFRGTTPLIFFNAKSGTWASRMFIGLLDNDVEEVRMNRGLAHVSEATVMSFDQAIPLRPKEKNWNPFELDRMLFVEYSINPHIVMQVNDVTGLLSFVSVSVSATMAAVMGRIGVVRGSAPSVLIPHLNQFLGLAHIKFEDESRSDNKANIETPRIYFHVFYMFEAKFPFRITSFSDIFSFPRTEEEFEDPWFIQFATGMVVLPGRGERDAMRVVISFGDQDCNAAVVEYILPEVLERATAHNCILSDSEMELFNNSNDDNNSKQHQNSHTSHHQQQHHDSHATSTKSPTPILRVQVADTLSHQHFQMFQNSNSKAKTDDYHLNLENNNNSSNNNDGSNNINSHLPFATSSPPTSNLSDTQEAASAIWGMFKEWGDSHWTDVQAECCRALCSLDPQCTGFALSSQFNPPCWFRSRSSQELFCDLRDDYSVQRFGIVATKTTTSSSSVAVVNNDQLINTDCSAYR